jgi:hypothetical protein
MHNEELHNLYASKNITRMRLVGHVERMGAMRNAYNILLENLKGRGDLEDLGVDGRIILEIKDEKVWAGFIWLRIETSSGLL